MAHAHIRNKMIVPPLSPWSSELVLMEKRNGEIRMCTDYRAWSRQTIPDSFPMPRVEDALDALGGRRHFTKIDVKSGYWQVPLTKLARHKTAFSTPWGLFKFTVMPFGLQNAPTSFQRMMNFLLRQQVNDGFVVVYLDEMLITIIPGKSISNIYGKTHNLE